jgi:hypothetical protein
VKLSVPPAPSFDVTLFAIVWPAMKLIVELVGLTIGSGPMNTNPTAVGSVIVRLPEIPTAVGGTLSVMSLGNWLTTVKVRGTPLWNGFDRPMLFRVSRTRLGESGTYPDERTAELGEALTPAATPTDAPIRATPTAKANNPRPTPVGRANLGTLKRAIGFPLVHTETPGVRLRLVTHSSVYSALLESSLIGRDGKRCKMIATLSSSMSAP